MWMLLLRARYLFQRISGECPGNLNPFLVGCDSFVPFQSYFPDLPSQMPYRPALFDVSFFGANI
jgi:hypothetical protein